jgi:hypothetical protein
MINTYMDRVDAATGHQPPKQATPDYGSLLYYRGNWYVSVIDRMVAEAKDNLALHISLSCIKHKAAMARGAAAREAGWKDLCDYDSEVRHDLFMAKRRAAA